MPQIERRARRHVQQAGVFLLAFDLAVRPRERIGEVVRDVAIELLVFLVLHLGARPGPQRLRVVDRFVLGASASSLLSLSFFAHACARGTRCGRSTCAPASGCDSSAKSCSPSLRCSTMRVPRSAVQRLDAELAVAARLPVHARRRIEAGAARIDVDAVGDDERRIEADAELADQLRVLLLVAGHARREIRRCRTWRSCRGARWPRRGSCRCRCRRS